MAYAWTRRTSFHPLSLAMRTYDCHEFVPFSCTNSQYVSCPARGARQLNLRSYTSRSTWNVWNNHRITAPYVRCSGLGRGTVADLKLSYLAPRAGQPTYWELVQLKGTNSWQSYVRMAREGGWKLVLLVQAYAKPTPPSAAEQGGGADAEETGAVADSELGPARDEA